MVNIVENQSFHSRYLQIYIVYFRSQTILALVFIDILKLTNYFTPKTIIEEKSVKKAMTDEMRLYALVQKFDLFRVVWPLGRKYS
jgi:hypothetical protein